MFKRYGDTVVNYVDGTATDEFEAAVYHKANTVGMITSLLAAAAIGAVLAWVLPSRESILSALVFLIPAVSSAVGTTWMRNYVASPIIRLRDMPRTVVVTYSVLCAIGLVGIIVAGGFGQSDGVDGAGASGAVIGAVVGALTAGALTYSTTKRRRRRDLERLDAQAED